MNTNIVKECHTGQVMFALSGKERRRARWYETNDHESDTKEAKTATTWATTASNLHN